jgi:hypothetical protein
LIAVLRLNSIIIIFGGDTVVEVFGIKKQLTGGVK